MATGGSSDLDEVVDSYRNDFGDADAVRADDVDELCEHFRDVVLERLGLGDSIGGAAEVARLQVGLPQRIVEEMACASHPPRYYRRWCVVLVAYAVAQAVWILSKVAGLSVSAYAGGLSLPNGAPPAYEYSALAVLFGLFLIVSISRRFGLWSMGRGTRGIESVFVSVLQILGLGVVLLLGLIFVDYWQWWFRTGTAIDVSRCGSVLLALGAWIGGPVLALSTVTGLRRWHPALRQSVA